MYQNIILKKANLPNLEKSGYGFLKNNRNLIELNMPKLPELEKIFKECINVDLETQQDTSTKVLAKKSIEKPNIGERDL